MQNIKYTYKNLSIPGGGFVTGLIYHPKVEGLLYCRTDIGGCYRYNRENSNWIPLIDKSTFYGNDRLETFPLAIAVCSSIPDNVYTACGDGSAGRLFISHDRGDNFDTSYMIPSKINGNGAGRGTGERLAVDGNNPEIIYFGSKDSGLLRSDDGGATWSSVCIGNSNEKEITFVFIDERQTKNKNRSEIIIVGTTGEKGADSKEGKHRGHGLYISFDGGYSFNAMPEPEQKVTSYSNKTGYVATRAASDGKYLYISFTASGEGEWCGFGNYSCDSNDSSDGRLIRYRFNENHEIIEVTDITPEQVCNNDGSAGVLGCGIGGVSASISEPGLLLASTINRSDNDMVMISHSYGDTWEIHLTRTMLEHYDFTVNYQRPEYNGGTAPIHWLSCIVINPTNCNEAVFNSGNGVYMTKNLNANDYKWETASHGIEETVHLNLYSPPQGEVHLIDILGDLGGFVFKTMDDIPQNSFADDEGNRYVTCCNADFAESDTKKIVVSARGNWTGTTKGGLIYSKNQGKTFIRLPYPEGITDRIDQLLNEIKRPNVNSGWGAISADANTIVWSIGDINALPLDAVVYTRDEGITWKKSIVYGLDGQPVPTETICPPRKEFGFNYDALWAYQESIKGLKVMSDRVDSKCFYGFGEMSKMYVSLDGAESFRQCEVIGKDGETIDFPKMGMAGIDMSYHGELRVESGKNGVIWIAMEKDGLWKIVFDRKIMKFRAERITAVGESIYAQGMGMGKEDAEGNIQYKTLYVGGVIAGQYGFYRSFNEGKTWEHINNSRQMFGELKYMTGDPRVFGRVYIATGTRGVLYGEPV